MSFELAKQHFLQGLAELQTGALSAAEASFEASLALVPDRPSTLINLGTARLALGKNAQALVALAHAATLDGSNLGLWLQCAQLQQEQNQLPNALASLDQALALNANNGAVWSNRGMLLRDLQRKDEAAASFEKAFQLGHNPALNAFYLASVRATAADAPAFAPRAYVENLFDNYADEFSGHLVQALNYRGHERLVQRLLQLQPRRFQATLDAGCGTGLCGGLIRSHTERLDGLDISAAMVEKARAATLYDEVFHADAVDHLRAKAAAAAARTDAGQHGAHPPLYDLILAADVCNYIGALEPLFEAAYAALARGGQFCFTVEAMEAMGMVESGSADSGKGGDLGSALGSGPGYGDMRLLPSLRYAHAQAYVRRLAAKQGFEVDALFGAPLREDQGTEIAAWYVFLTKPA
jgi:predicted TPR repeat methyltransferase